MTNNITGPRHYKRRIFQQVSPPLTLTKPKGAMIFDWATPPKKATRDAATHASIGAVAKQRMALDPQKLTKVLAAMSDIAARIQRLEAKRAAPTHDAPCACKGTLVTEPDGSAVFLGEGNRQTFVAPTHRRSNGEPDTFAFTPTRDTTMPTRNPALAPNTHIEGHQHKLRDKLSFADRVRKHFADAAKGATFGEQPSRFTSAEADRMARHIVGAGMPTAAELNAVNHRAHAGAGASGQTDNAVQPGGEGGQSGVNRRGGMLEAQPSETSEGFASELAMISSGQPQTALNAYHAAFHKARTLSARDAIDKIWSAYQRR